MSVGRTRTNVVLAAVTAAMMVATTLAGLGTTAAAQDKGLSDKSLALMMDYAWAIMPAKFTLPSNKVIIVDLKNRAAAMVPVETARDVVKVGRLSANAQICGLREEEGSNYQTMMAREQAKSKWSDQQLLYISQLHLLTVMMLTGRVNVVATEGDDKKVVVEDHTKDAPPKPQTCSETERAQVGKLIQAYLDAGGAAEPKK